MSTTSAASAALLAQAQQRKNAQIAQQAKQLEDAKKEAQKEAQRVQTLRQSAAATESKRNTGNVGSTPASSNRNTSAVSAAIPTTVVAGNSRAATVSSPAAAVVNPGAGVVNPAAAAVNPGAVAAGNPVSLVASNSSSVANNPASVSQSASSVALNNAAASIPAVVNNPASAVSNSAAPGISNNPVSHVSNNSVASTNNSVASNNAAPGVSSHPIDASTVRRNNSVRSIPTLEELEAGFQAEDQRDATSPPSGIRLPSLSPAAQSSMSQRSGSQSQAAPTTTSQLASSASQDDDEEHEDVGAEEFQAARMREALLSTLLRSAFPGTSGPSGSLPSTSNSTLHASTAVGNNTSGSRSQTVSHPLPRTQQSRTEQASLGQERKRNAEFDAMPQALGSRNSPNTSSQPFLPSWGSASTGTSASSTTVPPNAPNGTVADRNSGLRRSLMSRDSTFGNSPTRGSMANSYASTRTSSASIRASSPPRSAGSSAVESDSEELLLRQSRGETFQETDNLLQSNELKLNSEQSKEMLEKTEIIQKPEKLSIEPGERTIYASTRCNVVKQDSLTAALALSTQGYNPAILICAQEGLSSFAKGMTNQDASIYCRTNYSLVFNQKNNKLREQLKFPSILEKGKYLLPQFFCGAVYTPAVQIFRANEDNQFANLKKPLGLTVDVVAVSPLDFRPLPSGCKETLNFFAQGNDRKKLMDYTQAKLRAALRTAANKGHDSIVLNDFGFEFGNVPNVIVQCYKQILSEPEFTTAFKVISFAIDDKSPESDHYKLFLNEFDDAFRVERNEQVVQNDNDEEEYSEEDEHSVSAVQSPQTQRNNQAPRNTPVQRSTSVQQNIPVQLGIPVQRSIPVQRGIPVQDSIPVQQSIPVQRNPQSPTGVLAEIDSLFRHRN